ncbi:hypothetical protein [Streptomyces sp. CA-146814]|uniref:hypothetical protein n=1 Tax=Streptomyces sp. CA-146814 TaxID=3240053 RepID=UPI003D8EEFC3
MASMVGGARSGSAVYGQLLLLAALLLGIVTMHTVGHPAEHASSPSVSAAPVAAADAASDAAHPSHHSPDDTPMSGMDPLSVCLAVLGVWGLALVGAWLLGLRVDGRSPGTPVGAGLLRVLRANPPPRISVLASVSVLRI